MVNSHLLSFFDAKQLLLKEVKTLHYQTESVTLSSAVNRIIANPIISPMNIPSFNNSAMDGYVVRKSDALNGHRLPIAGTIFAGDSNSIKWPEGSCLRIMTGALIPDDAYAVIMQEKVEKQDNAILFNPDEIKEGQNIRYIGESIKLGEEILPAGTKLTIAKLSNLATLGFSSLTVYKPLKVAIFSTGNELVALGETLSSSSSIYDSNRFSLHLMLNALGCDVIDLGIIKDDLTLITNTLKQAAQQADIIITSGGVSVGDADYTKKALEEIGEINFWKIAMKPGKPFAFGKIDNTLFCGLPGNPVSTLVTFYHLVRPLILAYYGQKNQSETFHVKTVSNLKKSIGRVDFQRGYLYTNDEGERVVASAGEQGSHITSSFNWANCFIILEQDRSNVNEGELVYVEPFDMTLLS